MSTRLDALLTGRIAPLGTRAAPSGIAKIPTSGKQHLTWEGFETDQQGDRQHHGGREKAVHHYDYDHYPVWREEVGDLSVLRQPGAFGENLSTIGMSEHTVAVGDRFRIGSAVIEVSQGRQPCWKLNARFDRPDMAHRVQKTGRSGWYYRVLETGHVSADDSITLLDRKSPEWTLHRLWHVLYVDMLNFDELSAMTALPHLADGWKRYATRRLENRKVEDWTERLTGNEPASK